MSAHQDHVPLYMPRFGSRSSVETRLNRVDYRWETPEFIVRVTQLADGDGVVVGTRTEAVQWLPPVTAH